MSAIARQHVAGTPPLPPRALQVVDDLVDHIMATPIVMISLRCRGCDRPWSATSEAVDRTHGACPFCGSHKTVVTGRDG